MLLSCRSIWKETTRQQECLIARRRCRQPPLNDWAVLPLRTLLLGTDFLRDLELQPRAGPQNREVSAAAHDDVLTSPQKRSSPAADNAATVPVLTYIFPASVEHAATKPVETYMLPVPMIEYVAPKSALTRTILALLIEHMAPATCCDFCCPWLTSQFSKCFPGNAASV